MYPSPLSNNDSNTYMDETEILKNQMEKLQNWKDDIGIPAFNENEKLHSLIDNMKQQNNLQESNIYALTQENNALKIQLDTFHDEHHKWDEERNDLLFELDAISDEREASKKEEENWAHSVKHTYEKIDRLTIQHQRSNSDLLQSKQTISGLLEECEALEAQNDEYKLLTSKYEKILKNLNKTVKNRNENLSELQKKYDDIVQKYLAEKEKTQKILHDIVSNQLTEVQKSSNLSPAVPIPFSPIPSNGYVASSKSPSMYLSRKRSRSLDSDGANEKYIMHYLDIDPYYIPGESPHETGYDDHKTKEESPAREELKEKDEEIGVLVNKYNELQLEYDELQEQLNNLNQENVNKLFKDKQKQALRNDKNKKVFCGIVKIPFPWFSG